MSQNREQMPSEGQSFTASNGGEPKRMNYEGFEGMNYEQHRQPFNPRPVKDQRREGEGPHREES